MEEKPTSHTPFDLYKALLLPETVWGHFEWFTGMVRINIDATSFEGGLVVGLDKQGLDETYDHELFHCCQICTTGFLYYYVAQFLKEIAPVWRILMNDGVLTNKSMAQIIDSVVRNTPVLPAVMKQLLSNMDRRNLKSDLTAREIIESQAYFVQKTIRDTTVNHKIYLSKINHASSSEYTRAYTIASNHLGDQTFVHFNALVYCSLLFLEPQEVFEKICQRFSQEIHGNTNSSACLKSIASSISDEHLYLGNSIDVTERYIKNKELNPFYKSCILLLQKVCKEQKNDFFELMSNPYPWFKDTIKQFDVPIIFNPGDVYQHNQKKEWDVFGKSYNQTLHLILGTICLVINNQNNAPHHLHLKKTT